jgi:hypothetical protein
VKAASFLLVVALEIVTSCPGAFISMRPVRPTLAGRADRIFAKKFT